MSEVRADRGRRVSRGTSQTGSAGSSRLRSRVRPRRPRSAQAWPVQSRPKQSRPKQSRPKQSRPKQSRPKQSWPVQSRPKQSWPVQSRPKQSWPVQVGPGCMRLRARPETITPDEDHSAQTRPAGCTGVSVTLSARCAGGAACWDEQPSTGNRAGAGFAAVLAGCFTWNLHWPAVTWSKKTPVPEYWARGSATLPVPSARPIPRSSEAADPPIGRTNRIFAERVAAAPPR
jgi:hypothetical protein